MLLEEGEDGIEEDLCELSGTRKGEREVEDKNWSVRLWHDRGCAVETSPVQKTQQKGQTSVC